MKWSMHQKNIHDMSLVDGDLGVSILLNMMGKNDNKKVEEILEMVNTIGVDESHNILSNQIMIMNQQYDDVIVLGKINNEPKLKEWYTRVPSNY